MQIDKSDTNRKCSHKNFERSFLWALFLLFSLLSNPSASFSQEISDSPWFISFSGEYGKFQVHTKILSPFNGTHPHGTELEISRLFYAKEVYETCGCYAKLGLGLNYFDFDHASLGQGFTTIVYVEPFFKAKGQVRISLKAGTGVAWLNNPYHEVTNPVNMTYSTAVSFPLFIGFSAYYFMTRRMAVKTTLSFQHISNGGIKQPNYGINYPVAAIGLEYALQPYRIPPRPVPEPFVKTRSNEVDIGFTLKEDSTSVNRRPVVTIIPRHSLRVSRINALVLGALIEYEQPVDPAPFTDRIRIGAMTGNEFFMGQFRFGQQIGIYAYTGYSVPSHLFQSYYLNFYFGEHFIAGVQLKAHGRTAEYLSATMGYIF